MFIGLHMIVKGESHNIVQCLDSCKGLVDFSVIAVDDRVDSDETFNLIKDRPNTYVYRQHWEDSFATARNDSLTKLIEKCPNVDYILWIDGDDQWGTIEQGSISHEEVRLRLERDQPEAVNNEYIYAEELGSNNPNLSYLRLRIFKHVPGQPLVYEWEGSAHETLVSKRVTGRPTVTWKDWVLVHYRAKEIDFKSKTGRNIKMLEKDLEKNPTNTRTMFYLGREYKDHGDLEKSIVILTKYIHNSNFKLEKYQALLDLGYMYFWKGDLDSAEEKTKSAIDLIPEVAFAYNLLGEIYMKKNRPDLARIYFAQSVYAPHGPVLFDYIPSRTFLPYRWLSVACLYSGMKSEAISHHMKAKSIAPEDPGLKYNDPWLIDNSKPFPEVLEVSLRKWAGCDIRAFDANYINVTSTEQYLKDTLPLNTLVVGDSIPFLFDYESANKYAFCLLINQEVTEEVLDLAYRSLPSSNPIIIVIQNFGDWKVKNTVAKFLPKYSNIQLYRNFEFCQVNPSINSSEGIGILVRN